MIVLTAKQKNGEDNATYSMEMVAVNSKDNLYTMRLLSTRNDEVWNPITTIMTVKELEFISHSGCVKAAYQFAKMISERKCLCQIDASIITTYPPFAQWMSMSQEARDDWFEWEYNTDEPFDVHSVTRFEDYASITQRTQLENYVYITQHDTFKSTGDLYEHTEEGKTDPVPMGYINFRYFAIFPLSIFSMDVAERNEYIKEHIKDEITPLLKDAWKEIKQRMSKNNEEDIDNGKCNHE